MNLGCNSQCPYNGRNELPNECFINISSFSRTSDECNQYSFYCWQLYNDTKQILESSLSSSCFGNMVWFDGKSKAGCGEIGIHRLVFFSDRKYHMKKDIHCSIIVLNVAQVVIL